jgi:tetratricopeptide (TPR) repeat protein
MLLKIEAYEKAADVSSVTFAAFVMCSAQQFWALTRFAARREDDDMRMVLALLALAAAWSGVAGAADEAMGSTIIGSDPLLSEGTAALLAERWQQGIELIERGLAGAGDAGERAAAYSNLCAGYVAIRDFDRALLDCDAALELDAGNWRTYNNRAAALVGKGRLDEALHAVETGLALDPQAATLRTTESIVRSRLKRLYEPDRKRPGAPASQG